MRQIQDIIAKPLEKLGFLSVEINIGGIKVKNIELLIEKLDYSPVNLNDCSVVSKALKPLLDVELDWKDKYILHVSSAGVERSLSKIEDYKRFVGFMAKIKLHNPVEFGGMQHSTLKCKIASVDSNIVQLDIDGVQQKVDFSNIKKARLLFTEELFRKDLNKHKTRLNK